MGYDARQVAITPEEASKDSILGTIGETLVSTKSSCK